MKNWLLAAVLAVAGLGFTASETFAQGCGPYGYGGGGYGRVYSGYPSHHHHYYGGGYGYRSYYPPVYHSYRPSYPSYYGRGGVGIYFGF